MLSVSLIIIAAAVVYMVEAYIHTYYAIEYMHGTSLFFSAPTVSVKIT